MRKTLPLPLLHLSRVTNEEFHDAPLIQSPDILGRTPFRPTTTGICLAIRARKFPLSTLAAYIISQC
jgi:hypothetical protein